MPTYEYECTKCRYKFEKFQSMKDLPVRKCPKCRSKVKRLLGRGAGIIFKGSGFYETDYKRKGASRSETKTESKSPGLPADSKAKAATAKKE